VPQPHQKQALREAKFEKRLELALRDKAELQDEIKGWYGIRNDAAHGASIASGYEIRPVLSRAREIDALISSSLGAAPETR
jgi:hypothetical protein